MLLEFIKDLRRSDGHDVGIAGHRLPAGLKGVASTKLDRIELKRPADLVDHRLERGHGLHGPIAAHRSRGDAARMECKRRDVDFRGVIDAERRSPRNGRHAPGKIGEAAAVQGVIGGESDDLAGCAIDPDAGSHLESVPFDSGLKLIEAIVGQANGAIGKERRGQGRIERERSVVPPAEAAAAIGDSSY